MMDSLSWRMSWTERDIIGMLIRFLVMFFVPGFVLLLWSIAEPSNGWVMTLPQAILFFVFFPYSVVLVVVLLIRLSSGGEEHTAALLLDRGEGDSAGYRVDGQWSLEASCLGESRRLSFLPQDLEGFTKDLIGDSDSLAPWFRVVAWRKSQAPIVLFESVPKHIAEPALDWLHEKTGTKSPVFSS